MEIFEVARHTFNFGSIDEPVASNLTRVGTNNVSVEHRNRIVATKCDARIGRGQVELGCRLDLSNGELLA